MAREKTIKIGRGEAVTIPFSAYTTDTGSTSLDLTGRTVTFTVAQQRDSATKVIAETTATVTNAAGGLFEVALTASATNVSPGMYFWDVWITSTGYERQLGYGTFIVRSAARLP